MIELNEWPAQQTHVVLLTPGELCIEQLILEGIGGRLQVSPAQRQTGGVKRARKSLHVRLVDQVITQSTDEQCRKWSVGRAPLADLSEEHVVAEFGDHVARDADRLQRVIVERTPPGSSLE